MVAMEAMLQPGTLDRLQELDQIYGWLTGELDLDGVKVVLLPVEPCYVSRATSSAARDVTNTSLGGRLVYEVAPAVRKGHVEGRIMRDGELQCSEVDIHVRGASLPLLLRFTCTVERDGGRDGGLKQFWEQDMDFIDTGCVHRGGALITIADIFFK